MTTGTLNLDRRHPPGSSINALAADTGDFNTSYLNFNGGTLKAGNGAFTMPKRGVPPTVTAAYVTGPSAADGGASSTATARR